MSVSSQSGPDFEQWGTFVGEFTRVIPDAYEPSGTPARLCAGLLSIGELCAVWNWLVSTGGVHREKRYGDDPVWGIDANWLGYRVLRLADEESPPYLEIGDPASKEFRDSISNTIGWAEAAFRRWQAAGSPTETESDRTDQSQRAMKEWGLTREYLAGHGVPRNARVARDLRPIDYGNGRVECPRCEGRGFFAEFKHRDDGRCYLCFGRRWVWASREYRSF